MGYGQYSMDGGRGKGNPLRGKTASTTDGKRAKQVYPTDEIARFETLIPDAMLPMSGNEETA